jgi:raffinose/stachyose/melibiose transport system substrate-binding protein
MADLGKMGAFNKDMNSLENTQQRELYYNKKAAMFIEGSWSVSSLITDAPKDVLAATEITMIPAQAGKKELANVGAGGGGWGFVVSSGVKDKKLEAAAKFLKAMSSQQFGAEMIENGALAAVKVGSYDESKVDPFYKKFLEFNKTVHWSGVFDVQLSPQVVDAQYSGIQELLIGQLTPEKFAERLEQEHEASQNQ